MDTYNGISAGDTVMRVRGSFHKHTEGTVAVVTRLRDLHLIFDDHIGYSPQAYQVVTYASSLEALFNRQPVARLQRGGRTVTSKA